MKLNFTKMHGCGNDYIFIFCYDIEIKSPPRLSVMLSDRHTGVGGDGIVLILRSEIADAKMRMFNADGSEGLMCGNAIRCVAKYLYDNGIVKKTIMRIETTSGVRSLYLTTVGGAVTSVKADMGRAGLRPEQIPVLLDGDSVISRPVTVGGAVYEITCVSMGNPHAVIFRHDLEGLDICALGPLFERDALFPDRVNVSFADIVSRNRVNARVWERGSGETRACGTGACAVAVAAVLNGYCGKGEDIAVRLPGGELTVNYTDEAVYMTGDCVKVFEGAVEIPQG